METKEAIEAVIEEYGIAHTVEWLAGVINEKHERILKLEKEIVKIGGLIDSYPSAALQWQSTTPMPPQFRIMLHNDWWNTAIKTLKETSYIALKYREQIEEKQND